LKEFKGKNGRVNRSHKERKTFLKDRRGQKKIGAAQFEGLVPAKERLKDREALRGVAQNCKGGKNGGRERVKKLCALGS